MNWFSLCALFALIGVYYPAKDKLPIIVMEKMYNSLRGLVENHIEIPFINAVSILNDVCCGLQYLHSGNPPIVHRDITPNNILLCYHLRAKITDLGVARVIRTTDTKTLTKAPGTHDFMPPECLANSPVYGLPLDIFSFGGVILYVATQLWPQPTSWIAFDPNTGGRIVLTELQRRQQYLDKMTGDFTDLKPLVISCLDDNPKKRPSVSQVLLDIKKAKNAYHEKFYFMIWSTEATNKKQSTMQLRDEQNQVPNCQQEKREQTKLQEEQQARQLQRKEEKHEQQLSDVRLDVAAQDEVHYHIPSVAKSGIDLQQMPTQDEFHYDIPCVEESGNDSQEMESNYPLFVAKYDYASRADDDLGFNKGDLLYIINMDHEDWWFAKTKNLDQEGYIPSNYVAEFNPLESEE